jgi:Cu+-exporting ATPase
MSMSSVFVVTNALRLRFFKPKTAPVFTQAAETVTEEVIYEEEPTMETVITVHGMMCKHCQAFVEKALGAIDGADVTVDLEAGTATVTTETEIEDTKFHNIITEAGYELKCITRK